MRVGIWALAALAFAACGDDGATAADAAPTFDADFFVPPAPPPCGAQGNPGGFCNDALAMGIDRVQTQGGVYALPTGGVALADFDGDGDLDLFASGLQFPSAIYRNDGTGHFEDVTATAGLADLDLVAGSAAADFDDDGDQDLLLSGGAAPVRMFENDGSGRFADVSTSSGLTPANFDAASIAVADYDADGDLDFYVTTWVDSTAGSRVSEGNLLYRNDGGMSFTDATLSAGVGGGSTSYSLASAFVDIDSDTWPDLYVANDFGMMGTPNLDYRNNGDGTFTSDEASGGNVAVFGMSVSPADYDRDGDLDIYVTSVADNVLLRNDGAGRFDDVAVQAGVDAYGYRADDEEYLDYVAFDPESENPDERGLAQWAEQYLHPGRAQTHVSVGWSALWLDYDQDGWQDLYVCNAYISTLTPNGRREPNEMYRNLGDGTFERTTDALLVGDRGDARGCAVGDLDLDGDLDLVVPNVGWDDNAAKGVFVVLRNDAVTGGFARVHLEGVASNRDGIGALVQLTVDGQTQLRVVSGIDGFLSTSQRDAHFGLGASASIEQIRVVWPSGAIDVVDSPPANQTVTIVEGSSPGS